MNRNFTNLLLAIVLVLLASCATLTEEEKYERDDRFLQARDQFELKRISCIGAGGMIVRRTLGPSRRYSLHDYETAECVRGGIR